MKTIKKVILENKEYKTLINAVINNISIESVEDVNNHGVSGGISGFIYYEDTHKFAIKHRKNIIALLERDADDFGEEVVKMITNFGYFRNNKANKEDLKDIYKYLGGGRCDSGGITNLMAWYACETVCRWFEE